MDESLLFWITPFLLRNIKINHRVKEIVVVTMLTALVISHVHHSHHESIAVV
jgi:hypothetical protein